MLGLPLLLVLVMLFGLDALFEPERLTQGNWWQSAVMVLISVLQGIFAIWSMVLAVANLAEAHRFSLWRAAWTHLVVLIFWILLFTVPAVYLMDKGAI
ncbi:hypothetical protein [Ferrimonas gelatinilytica]|uniref:Uncharacterized protein n=1 Tax=Ferrimonas gelatinilytica TaxID=1255257 RepID=A0ABP9S2B5_9GAMM